MRASAIRALLFIYRWFWLPKDEGDRWVMDDMLGLIPSEERQAHNRAVLADSDGEVG